MLAGLVIGPISGAAAGTVMPFRDTAGPFTNVYEPCGATETVTITVQGREFFDDSGTSVRILAHFFFDSSVTGPTGTTIAIDSHQNAEFTPEGINTLTGQGPNVRAPGGGLLYQDVGRLVFSDATGMTLFTSAKAVSFEAADPDRLAAAICAAVS